MRNFKYLMLAIFLSLPVAVAYSEIEVNITNPPDGTVMSRDLEWKYRDANNRPHHTGEFIQVYGRINGIKGSRSKTDVVARFYNKNGLLISEKKVKLLKRDRIKVYEKLPIGFGAMTIWIGVDDPRGQHGENYITITEEGFTGRVIFPKEIKQSHGTMLPANMIETDFKGPKIRVAVLDFENKVPTGQADIGYGMSDMLITALNSTGRYTVLEREALADILGEQDFGRSSRAKRGTGPKLGKLLGAQLLIKGAVTEFSYNVDNSNIGIGYKGIGIGGSSSHARVACDIRIVDPTTGEILSSGHKERKVSASGFSISGSKNGISFALGANKNSPLGKAVRQIIQDLVVFVDDAVYQLNIKGVEVDKWEGRVIKVNGPEEIYITGGLEANHRPGQKLTVYRISETLTDPETGESLGGIKEEIGKLEIIKPSQKFSKCRALEGESFIRGDIVILH